MGFFNQRCPNCGKSVSKNADYCNACGCPSAAAWATCPRCAASVGSDSTFCWKCGDKQDLEARRKIYFDRWRRAPGDFAVRVELVTPDKTLHHGLQVEDGTLALIFRNGEFKGILEPGYHEFDSFWARFFNADSGGLGHAILLDAQSAEVDFYLDNIRTQDGVALDVRVRLLFKVTDPKMFADRFLTARSSYGTQDLSDAFHGDVRQAVQEKIGERPLESLIDSVGIREVIEEAVMANLTRAFAGAGLKTDGVRLADVAGETVETLRQKMADWRRVTLEREMERKMADALREDKVKLFTDENELNEYFEKASHELGFKRAEREEQRKHFLKDADHKLRIVGLRLDWSVEMEELDHQIEKRKRAVEAELQEEQKRFEVKQGQSVAQAQTDLEVGQKGLDLLKQVNDVKMQKRREEEDLALEVEKNRLELRGNANMQSLMATLDGEQADRLLKLAEMQMRHGMTPEQSLAFVVEKSPDYFAPALAEALKARFAKGGGAEAPKPEAPRD